ncbi:hypothetical protein CTI12_AA316170 [Artemisia annua]|uniref:Uncharacterized protein n=1 Tax=Artemisia annua TaxID=35608 RepID=A0A2U1LZX4_ARTAN|nr:hypothetical protein CTI12_AA316170 [Artemisia annua]
MSCDLGSTDTPVSMKWQCRTRVRHGHASDTARTRVRHACAVSHVRFGPDTDLDTDWTRIWTFFLKKKMKKDGLMVSAYRFGVKIFVLMVFTGGSVFKDGIG